MIYILFPLMLVVLGICIDLEMKITKALNILEKLKEQNNE